MSLDQVGNVSFSFGFSRIASLTGQIPGLIPTRSSNRQGWSQALGEPDTCYSRWLKARLSPQMSWQFSDADSPGTVLDLNCPSDSPASAWLDSLVPLSPAWADFLFTKHLKILSLTHLSPDPYYPIITLDSCFLSPDAETASVWNSRLVPNLRVPN